MNRVILTLTFLAALQLTFAQTSSSDVTISSLETPASPAFVLLDVAPSSIQNPTTAKAFGASVIDAVTQSNGIPKNYAVEFTPFWFVQKPHKMTFEKYYGIRMKSDQTEVANPFSSGRFVSLSFAFVNGSGKDSVANKYTNVAFGFKTTIVKIQRNISQVLTLRNQIHSYQDNIAAAVLAGTAPSDATIKAIWAQIATTNAQLQLLEKQKPIFALDFAGSAAMLYDTNNTSAPKLSRVGFWLTPAINIAFDKTDTNYFSFIGVGRYILDHTNEDSSKTLLYSQILDLGLQAEIQWRGFSFSLEALYRANLVQKSLSTYRFSGMLKYKVIDGLYISANFGRNFGPVKNVNGTVGLNYSFGFNGSSTFSSSNLK